MTSKKNEIVCKELVDSEEERFNLRLTAELPNELPPLIAPSGLSLDRKWYLYENVRVLCTDSQKRDFVAPKPSEPKAKKKSKNKSEPASKKKKSKHRITRKRKLKSKRRKKKKLKLSNGRKSKYQITKHRKKVQTPKKFED